MIKLKLIANLAEVSKQKSTSICLNKKCHVRNSNKTTACMIFIENPKLRHLPFQTSFCEIATKTTAMKWHELVCHLLACVTQWRQNAIIQRDCKMQLQLNEDEKKNERKNEHWMLTSLMLNYNSFHTINLPSNKNRIRFAVLISLWCSQAISQCAAHTLLLSLRVSVVNVPFRHVIEKTCFHSLVYSLFCHHHHHHHHHRHRSVVTIRM